MPLLRRARRCALILIAACGCQSASTQPDSAPDSAPTFSAGASLRTRITLREPAQGPDVAQASYDAATVAGTAPDPALPVVASFSAPATPSPAFDSSTPAEADDPFAGMTELPADRLVAEVQRRNPSLQAALAAWSAAAERYPQAVALDDPVLQSMFAPESFASSSNVQPSYMVGVAQKLPWPGKRALRGQMAQADASAAWYDSQEVQLRLTEAAGVAFFDDYLVARKLDLNAANRGAVRKFRETASGLYESNRVTQQDVLEADVELAKLDSREIELKQSQRIAVARINTLLHRAPNHPLPPPPRTLPIGADQFSAVALQELAVSRPELAAQTSRIQAEQAAVQLACKEFYPDFELMGRYDAFWNQHEQSPQIGLNVNIPLDQSRRQAAVREATFRLRKLQAEYDQAVDSIRHDVEAGLARLEGSRQTALLYDQRIVPAARKNAESAEIGYTAGKIDFLRLIEAQREVIALEEKQQDAIAEYHRRRAELERTVGSTLP